MVLPRLHLYLILVVAIAVTAVFYSHLEVGMGKQIRGFRAALAWVHLVGMNVDGAATTIAMIFAGLAGSGILDVILGASDTLQPNPAIMDQFVPVIAGFTGLLSIGVIAGGLACIDVLSKELTSKNQKIKMKKGRSFSFGLSLLPSPC